MREQTEGIRSEKYKTKTNLQPDPSGLESHDPVCVHTRSGAQKLPLLRAADALDEEMPTSGVELANGAVISMKFDFRS